MNNKYNQTTCEQTHAHTNIKNTKNRTQKPTANIWRVLPGASKTGNQEKPSHKKRKKNIRSCLLLYGLLLEALKKRPKCMASSAAASPFHLQAFCSLSLSLVSVNSSSLPATERPPHPLGLRWDLQPLCGDYMKGYLVLYLGLKQPMIQTQPLTSL